MTKMYKMKGKLTISKDRSTGKEPILIDVGFGHIFVPSVPADSMSEYRPARASKISKEKP